MSDQVLPQLKVLPPDAERIAKAGGPAIFKRYVTEGLLCFRTERPPTPAGQVLVDEGYMLPKTLPNGRTLHERVITRTLTREEAVNER